MRCQMKEKEQKASFRELKKLVTEQNLFQKQPKFYTWKIGSTFLLLAMGIAFFVMVNNFWLRMIDSIYLALVLVQAGLIMHDADHQQIFFSQIKNKVVGFIAGNMVIGLSSRLWTYRHDLHHQSPNIDGLDPDIEIPLLAFTHEQAIAKKGLAHFVTKYQAFLWFPLLAFQAFRMRISYIVGILQDQSKSLAYRLCEASTIVLNVVLYVGLVFFFLEWWQALFFIFIHQAFTGIYMASVFATNHKAMPILSKKLDFLHTQVITARNVVPSPITDFLMGGLNYQIEHHLFPYMPRNNLGKARKIVKKYCQDHEIPYVETGYFTSYKEILQHLHKVGAVLRTKKKKK
jgi:fatty acid desaturase